MVSEKYFFYEFLVGRWGAKGASAVGSAEGAGSVEVLNEGAVGTKFDTPPAPHSERRGRPS